MSAKYATGSLDIYYDCPACGAENCDDYIETAVPMCGECHADIEWDDILTNFQFYELNHAKKVEEVDRH